MARSTKNLIAGFAAILLVVAATWRPPVPEPRIGFDLIFQFSTFCLLAVVLWIGSSRADSPLRATAGCKYWAMFLMLAFMSRIIAFYTLGRLSIVSYVAFFSVLSGVLWFFLLVMFVDSDRGVKYLMDAMCVIALFNVLFLALQHFTIDPLWKPKGGGQATAFAHSVGLMSDRNNASALLAFCFPAFLRSGWIWLAILPLVGLVRTMSCGGAFALGAGLLCYAMFLPFVWQYKAVVVGGVLVVLLLYSVFVDSPALSMSSERVVIAKQGLEVCKDKPFLGAGIGQWKVTFLQLLRQKKYAGPWMSHAHNEYLQMFYELGVGFLAILSGYLVSIARRIRRQAAISVTALVVILVNCLVNFPFHVATTAMIAVTWLGILELQLLTKGARRTCQTIR